MSEYEYEYVYQHAMKYLITGSLIIKHTLFDNVTNTSWTEQGHSGDTLLAFPLKHKCLLSIQIYSADKTSMNEYPNIFRRQKTYRMNIWIYWVGKNETKYFNIFEYSLPSVLNRSSLQVIGEQIFLSSGLYFLDWNRILQWLGLVQASANVSVLIF